MGDDMLDDIRARRLAQLQNEYKGPGGSATDKAAAEEERRATANEMKNSMLSQVLTQGARARLNTLMIGKPEKGKLVENLILQMAQTGQIMNRLSEEELIGLLEKVNQQFGSKQKTTVKFDRRRAALDSDDEL
ncbi:programmed cell death protein 5 [Planococcus citri]|uniref:programmed cell death protein 5 n=1 Tax=Planococcus citri TaxID=170843 RepID=UPI0031F7E5E5